MSRVWVGTWGCWGQNPPQTPCLLPSVLAGVSMQSPVLVFVALGYNQRGVSVLWMWPHPQGDKFLRRGGSLGCSPPPCRVFVEGSWGAASFPAGYGVGLGVPVERDGGSWGAGPVLEGRKRCPLSARSSPALGWKFHRVQNVAL